MALSRKVLGQSAPSGSSWSSLYSVPTGSSTVCSSLIVCNRSNVSSDTFSIAIRVNGVSLENKQYIYKDLEVPRGNSFVATIGITLGSADVIDVYSTNGNLSFSIFGEEAS